jgi:hypothetical protein
MTTQSLGYKLHNAEKKGRVSVNTLRLEIAMLPTAKQRSALADYEQRKRDSGEWTTDGTVKKGLSQLKSIMKVLKNHKGEPGILAQSDRQLYMLAQQQGLTDNVRGAGAKAKQLDAKACDAEILAVINKYANRGTKTGVKRANEIAKALGYTIE